MNEADLTKLIQSIAERLVKRQNSSTDVYCQKNFQQTPVPEKNLFFDYDRICLKQIHVAFLKDLFYLNKEEPWVDWILTGISYQVHMVIEVNDSIIPFIPWKMLTQWPIEFMLEGQKLISFNKRTIKRQDIFTLENNSQLIKTKEQKLTDEAISLIRQKQISVIERTDQECIWGA